MKPEKTIRVGSVSASIFANKGEHGPFYSVTLGRRYSDKDGEWQTSSSFNAKQLRDAISAAGQALEYLEQQEPAGVKAGEKPVRHVIVTRLREPAQQIRENHFSF